MFVAQGRQQEEQGAWLKIHQGRLMMDLFGPQVDVKQSCKEECLCSTQLPTITLQGRGVDLAYESATITGIAAADPHVPGAGRTLPNPKTGCQEHGGMAPCRRLSGIWQFMIH